MLNNYRPIFVCNTTYKVFAKLLAIQLKLILPKIIHLAQATFLHGRDITHNVILVNELLISYNSNSYGPKFFSMIDLIKAFDKDSQNFLYARMEQLGFPSKFINWIYACTAKVDFSVIINGKLKGYFCSSTSLR